MKIYNPNLEERAFLYQEAQDLETLMRNLGSLSVMVEETLHHRYRVTFVVAPETVAMRVRAVDDNLYDATIAARVETQKQLNLIVNSLPRPAGLETRPEGTPYQLLH
ncbi:MAG TPA: hypothetical protein PKC28_14810 [Bdellovibrionales bacterium]|nr:hypothetical protein [Bdellovibrionales bacterium]